MTKKKIAIISIVSLIDIYLIYSYLLPDTDGKTYLMSKVEKGDFISEVITSGEAQSTSLEKINGPNNLRKFKLNN